MFLVGEVWCAIEGVDLIMIRLFSGHVHLASICEFANLLLVLCLAVEPILLSRYQGTFPSWEQCCTIEGVDLFHSRLLSGQVHLILWLLSELLCLAVEPSLLSWYLGDILEKRLQLNQLFQEFVHQELSECRCLYCTIYRMSVCYF